MYLFFITIAGLLAGLLLHMYIYLYPLQKNKGIYEYSNYTETSVTIDKKSKQVELRILK